MDGARSEEIVKVALKPLLVPILSRKTTLISIDLTFANDSAMDHAEGWLPLIRIVNLEKFYGAAGRVRDFEAARKKLMDLIGKIVSKEALSTLWYRP